jgi:hypothetical protein
MNLINNWYSSGDMDAKKNTQRETRNLYNILFVCTLFNDAVVSSGYIASTNILVGTHEEKRPFGRSRNKQMGR